jgi:hypothetical protein
MAQQPPPASRPAPLPLTVESVPVPAGANTTEPQITAGGGKAILSWLELQGPRATLKFAVRSGGQWSEAKIVASGDDFMINSADVPSVIALADGTLAAQWLQQDGPDPESYKIRIAFSKDNGTTWSAPVYPHHDKAETQHGFVSMFHAPGGGLGLVWLDGRAIRPEAPEGAGNMAMRATTFGADGKQRVETVVDQRVCECCQTSAAETADGVIVAYRNRSTNEIRDIYVTRLAAGRWTPPVVVHNDGWRIEGCPVNGPAVSARNRDVAVAWFTGKGNQEHAFIAFSHDGGRTFGSPVRVDDQSALGRVDLELLDDGSAAVTWVEAGNPSQLKVRRVEPGGAMSASVRVAESSGTRVPRLGRSGDELIFAWTATDNDQPRIRTAHASLPPAK